MKTLLVIVLLAITSSAQQRSTGKVVNPDASSKTSGIQQRDAQQKAKAAQNSQTQSECTHPLQQVSTQAKDDPYSPSKDPLYRASLWATIIGVGFGMLGLSAIYDQARAAVTGQRAQLAAAPHGDAPDDLTNANPVPRVQLAIKNVGLTTAYEIRYQSWIELLPFPFVDFTAKADHFVCPEPSALYPNSQPLIINMPIRTGLTESERQDMFKQRKYVCLRVQVKYRDAFKRKRYANFAYFVVREGLSFLPKYNDAN